MKETPAELAALQSLLEASLAGATEHLRAIVTPARTLDARELCDCSPACGPWRWPP